MMRHILSPGLARIALVAADFKGIRAG